MFGYIQDSNQMNVHGIGLGLNLSKRIIEQFSGDIEVDSVFGEGSTFKFTLKLYEACEDQIVEQRQQKVFNSDNDSFVYEWQPLKRINSINYINE